ncbi:MAG: biosynthetic arginine decarboxylase, partial [Planctomycetes bacterium]|nr:biosynthetic arginine decarboxylase [Planctomycetota bacterium]
MNETLSDQTLSTATEQSAWTVEDSAELYQIDAWSNGYFCVAPNGDVRVTPLGDGTKGFSLHDLVVDLCRRGHQLPLLLRFSEIMRHRLQTLNTAFQTAISEYGYRGSYRSVFPIKVNQQADILEELLDYGRPLRMGLEAGSKPEVLVALAYTDQPDGIIVCNGYKDAGYIETALLAQELGRYPILVIDRFAELEMIIRISQRIGIRPSIGIRARLASRGSGRWDESSGAKSKFGLSASEILHVIERLRGAEMLDCVELLHFHIGSQVTEIRAIKEALREAARIYVEIHRLGAKPSLIDVGGGLGVDYDGTKSNANSSINYSLQEYANDVVDALQRVCDGAGVPHPEIISESGRALSAYHSVLVFDVLGADLVDVGDVGLKPATAGDPLPLHGLYEAWAHVDAKSFLERYHDAVLLRDEATTLFNLGYLD